MSRIMKSGSFSKRRQLQRCAESGAPRTVSFWAFQSLMIGSSRRAFCVIVRLYSNELQEYRLAARFERSVMKKFIKQTEKILKKTFAHEILNGYVFVSDVDFGVKLSEESPLWLNAGFGCVTVGVDFACQDYRCKDLIVSYFLRSVANQCLASAAIDLKKGVWRSLHSRCNGTRHKVVVEKISKKGYCLKVTYDIAYDSASDVEQDVKRILKLFGKFH